MGKKNYGSENRGKFSTFNVNESGINNENTVQKFHDEALLLNEKLKKDKVLKDLIQKTKDDDILKNLVKERAKQVKQEKVKQEADAEDNARREEVVVNMAKEQEAKQYAPATEIENGILQKGGLDKFKAYKDNLAKIAEMDKTDYELTNDMFAHTAGESTAKNIGTKIANAGIGSVNFFGNTLKQAWDNTMGNVDDKFLIDKTYSDKYDGLIAKKRAYETPVLAEIDKGLDNSLKNSKDNLTQLMKKQQEIGAGYNSGNFDSKGYDKLGADIVTEQKNQAILKNSKRQTSDFLENNTSMWAGFLSERDGLESAGMAPYLQKEAVRKVTEKQDANLPEITDIEKQLKEQISVGAKPFDREKLETRLEELQLSQAEKNILDTEHLSQQLSQQDLNKGRYGYKTAKGVANSAIMGEQIGLSVAAGEIAGLGAVLGSAAEFVAPNVMRASAMGLEMTGSQALALRAIKIVQGAVSTVAETAATPMPYDIADTKYIGMSKQIELEDGTMKTLVGKSARLAYAKEYKDQILDLKLKEQNINKKVTKSESDVAELEKIATTRENLEFELDQIYDEKTHKMKDVTAMDARIYGLVEAFKENATEKIGGEAVAPLAKGIAKLGGKVIGEKASNTIGNVVEDATGGLTKVYQKGLDNINYVTGGLPKKIGLLSSKFATHTGTSKLYHGIPGEIAEEIMSALAPSYQENWFENYKKDVQQLGTMSFYADTVAQTALMGALPFTTGLVSNAVNYKANERQRVITQGLKDIFEKIDKSTTDEDLANHIAMSTGGTLFSESDYRTHINGLRLKDTEESNKQADTLEKKSFLHLAKQAIETGTLSDYSKALNKVANNSTLSEATRVNAVAATAKIKELERIKEKFGEHENFPQIFQHAFQKMVNKQSLEDLSTNLDENKVEVNESIERFKRENGYGEEFNIDNMAEKLKVAPNEALKTFVNEVGETVVETNQEYHKFIADLRKADIGNVNKFMDLQTFKGMYEEVDNLNTKQLEHETSNKRAQEFAEQKRLNKLQALLHYANPENIGRVKEQIQIEGELTPELNSQLNNKVNSEEVVELPLPENTVEFHTIPVETLEDPLMINGIQEGSGTLQLPKENNNEEPPLDEEMSFEDGTSEDFLSLSPIVVEDENPRHKQIIDGIASVLQSSVDRAKVDGKSLKGLNFEAFIHSMINDHGAGKADLNFNFAKEAWNKVGVNPISESEAVSVHERIFAPSIPSNILDAGTGVTVTEPLKPRQVEAVNEIAVKPLALNEAKPQVITELFKSTVLYAGRKPINYTNKVPFLGMNYDEQEEDGIVSLIDTSDTINDDAIPFLDWNNIQPNDVVSLKLTDSWKNPDMIVPHWENVDLPDGNKMLQRQDTNMKAFLEKTFKKPFHEVIAMPLSELLKNETFKKKVPIDLVNNKDGAVYEAKGHHDYFWWNERNTGNTWESFLPASDIMSNMTSAQRTEAVADAKLKGKIAQQNLINEAKAKNLEVRNQIFDSPTFTFNMKVTRETGTTIKSTTEGDMKSIAEANPSARLAIFDGSNFIGNDGVQIESKAQIVNYDKMRDVLKLQTEKGGKGMPVMIAQIGTDTFNGEVKPIYAVYAVHTNPANSQEELGKLNSIRRRLDKVKDIMIKIQKGESIAHVPDAEIEMAKKVYTWIRKEYKLDISNVADLMKLVDYFPKKDSDGNFNWMIKKEKMDTFQIPMLDMQTDGQGNVTGVNLSKQSYKETLLKTIRTQHNFVRIQSVTGETIYINDIQPKIILEPLGINEEGHFVTQTTLPIITIEKPTVLPTDINEIEVEVTKEFDNSHVDMIHENLFHKTLSKININEDFSLKQVYGYLEEAYNETLESLKEKFPREHQFMLENKDTLLGIQYEDSVRESLDTFFNQSEETTEEEDTDLNDTGEYVKDSSKNSFENNIITSLSAKSKLFLTGIVSQQNAFNSSFGNLESFEDIDDLFNGLLEAFSGSKNNSMEALETIMQQKIALSTSAITGKSEYHFYKEILARLKDAPTEIKNEFLYSLYQSNVNMSFVMYNVNKEGKYTLQVYDADNKNPDIKKKNDFKNYFKSSELITNNGNHYSIKQEESQSIINIYEGWLKNKNYSAIPVAEVDKVLSTFGIKLNTLTIENLLNGHIQSDMSIESMIEKDLINRLILNLKQGITLQKTKQLYFNKREVPTEGKFFNLLENENNNYLKNIITLDNLVTFNPAISSYIAGKTINKFEQPKFISEQIKKLSNLDEKLINDLSSAEFSKDSFILNLIKGNPELASLLNSGIISLEGLKKMGESSQSNMGITDMSIKDYYVTLIGQFTQMSKGLGEYVPGVKMRMTNMSFPTLSDVSTLPIMNTIGLDLTKINFEIEGDNVRLEEDVIDILFTQLVKGDLNRISAFMKANTDTNIKGHDFGAKLFTGLPSLNGLVIETANGTKKTLIQHLHTELKKGVEVDAIIEAVKADINNEIRNVIDRNVDGKINKVGEEMTGFFVDQDIMMNGTLQFVDEEYLKSKGSDLTEYQKARITAYDYAVNYYMNQAQIQMLFGGDITNYFKDYSKYFTNGDVTMPEFTKDGKFNFIKHLINEFYPSKYRTVTSLVDTMYIADKASNEYKEAVDVLNEFYPKILNHSVEEGLNVQKHIYIDIAKDVANNLSKRLKEYISPGSRLANSAKQNSIQIMISDVENSSEVLGSLVKNYYPEQYNEYKPKIDEFKVLDSILEDTRTPAENTRHKALFSQLKNTFPKISSYLKTASTDAQEWVSWQDNLTQLLVQGRVSDEVYNTLHDKLTSQTKNGVNEDNMLTLKEMKYAVMQPSKPLYAGLHFENHNGYNAQRYIYIKSSSFPMIPQLTQGFRMDKIRKNIEKIQAMNKDKNVRVSFDSANKVGAVNKAISISHLYKDEFNEQDIKKTLDSSVELDKENFSIQQDKPFKTDKNLKNKKREEIGRGTQFEKILLGNGVNKIKEKIFPNLFDTEVLVDLGIEPTELISGVDLATIYEGLYKKEQEFLKNKLFNELGIGTYEEFKEGNVKLYENLAKNLNKRLSNKQDKEALAVIYYVKEGDKYVGYSKKEVKDKNLNPVKADFTMPLWNSPNSRKFEAVLNSIINNNSINLKLPGFSSPVASQEGFQVDSYEEYIKSNSVDGVVFTDSFDGTLKATTTEDGTLKHAQILVANKFKVNVKNEETGEYGEELIDLRKYLKADNKTLDFEKLPKELLEIFSFRIPTSAHQSGVVLEIVGFLPHTSGDLMIVPKDHTVQLGEDYDIDTRYVYGQNYRVDGQGNIKRVNTKYIENKIKALQEAYDTSTDLDDVVDRLLTSMFPEQKEEVEKMFAEHNFSEERRVKSLIDALRYKVTENNISNLYKSVFSSTDTEMSKLISSTLSTDFAEDTASMIDDKINSAKNSSTFSIYDDNHQQSTLELGASGKLGIGVHSNWVTFNSLLQQSNSSITLFNGVTLKGNVRPFFMKFGNLSTDGKLGNINASGKNPRKLSTINMENQNSSTDNQKLQIMGRRNENKHTINVFALMENLGIDSDVMKDGKEVSYASLFISQPILRRYVELINYYSSYTTSNFVRVEDVVQAQLLKEYGEGIVFATNKMGEELPGVLASKDTKRISAEITGDVLYDSLIKGSNEQQWLVYSHFKALSAKAKDINKIQQFINIENGGLGISFFNVLDMKNFLLDGLGEIEASSIASISDLIGDYVRVDEGTMTEEMKAKLDAEQYVHIGLDSNKQDVYIKPKTFFAHKIVNSIATGYNLWKNVMPYENQFIQEQINGILAEGKVKEGTKLALEEKYEIISSMKDFMFNKNSALFSEDMNIERNRLFLDTDSSESLATYLSDLKKANHPLMKEHFFRDLEFILNKETEPSIIKYTVSNVSKLNKNKVHKTFRQMFDNDAPLPANFNGKKYTYAELAKDLLKYSLMSNQENGAIGFRQHLPMDLLNRYGVSKSSRILGNVNANMYHNLLFNGNFKALESLLGSLNDKNLIINANNIEKKVLNSYVKMINASLGKESVRVNESNNIEILENNEEEFKSIFQKQYIQHNINKIKPESNLTLKALLKAKGKESIADINFFYEKDSADNFKVLKQGTIKFLYENVGNGVFRKINTLGGYGVNEYNTSKDNNNSVFQKNNVKISPEEIYEAGQMISNINRTGGDIENSSVEQIIQDIANSDNRHKDFASLLLPFLDKDTKIVIIDSSVASGAFNSNDNAIYISKAIIDSSSQEVLNGVVMEEFLHSLTVRQLRKHVRFSMDENGVIVPSYKNLNTPASVVKLAMIYKEGFAVVLDKYTKQTGSKEKAIAFLKDKFAGFSAISDPDAVTDIDARPTLNKSEIDTYRVYNIDEFLAGMFLTEEFKETMSKTQYKQSGKTLLESYAKAVVDLLKKLLPAGAVDDSIHEHATTALYDFLNAEKNYKPNKEVEDERQQQDDVEAEELLRQYNEEQGLNLDEEPENGEPEISLSPLSIEETKNLTDC